MASGFYAPSGACSSSAVVTAQYNGIHGNYILSQCVFNTGGSFINCLDFASSSHIIVQPASCPDTSVIDSNSLYPILAVGLVLSLAIGWLVGNQS